MRALVIGHRGFVGRHLCSMLRAADYEVVGIEDFDSFAKSTDWIVGSVNGKEHSDIFDVIVHLGANIINVNDRMSRGMRSFDDITLDYRVCSWVEEHRPRKCFIAMSSCAIDYPDDPYCIIKRTLEAYAHTLFKKGVPVVILRPYGGYGPDQSAEYPYRAIWERALRREDPLTVWGSGQVRDLIWIDDLCAGIMAAIDRFPRGGIYTLGTGVPTSFVELAQKIADAVGYCPTIKCDTSKPSSGMYRVASVRGQPDYGWEPMVSVDEGIQKTLEYFHAAERI